MTITDPHPLSHIDASVYIDSKPPAEFMWDSFLLAKPCLGPRSFSRPQGMSTRQQSLSASHTAALSVSPSNVATASSSPGSTAVESGSFLLHQVQAGDTLEGICIAYHVQAESVKRLNQLWTNDSIHLRPTLRIPYIPVPAVTEPAFEFPRLSHSIRSRSLPSKQSSDFGSRASSSSFADDDDDDDGGARDNAGGSAKVSRESIPTHTHTQTHTRCDGRPDGDGVAANQEPEPAPPLLKFMDTLRIERTLASFGDQVKGWSRRPRSSQPFRRNPAGPASSDEQDDGEWVRMVRMDSRHDHDCDPCDANGVASDAHTL
ncbi:uncharacterized protein BJ171DRAFT_580189 [Polychytrium aggregatum]|uniref:uncharacterized protein n=1 Tax=Polychytrium aggregatum TaxID=110093 RepID=UPI0022FF1303|nr:uncharacterized protein BJ171DRAFT_580189 [Polychytrium aggregatum]KAI9206113.1 hypothetical protein BJ171DRAFT_580189 [Polychytrium aggregatum]